MGAFRYALRVSAVRKPQVAWLSFCPLGRTRPRDLVLQIMTMKKAVALTLAASSLFLAGCSTTHHVTQWEYKNVTLQGYQLRPPNYSSALDDLGKAGWQVVGFSHATGNQGDNRDYDFYYYVLKRKLQ